MPEPSSKDPGRTDRVDLPLALLALGGLLGLPGTALGRLYAPLPEQERRVQKLHVGVERLAGKGLCSVRLALLLVGQLLGRLAILLGLSVQVVDGLVEEGLGELSALLLRGGATLGYCLVGLHEGLGELIGSLVNPLLALLVHGLSETPFFTQSWQLRLYVEEPGWRGKLTARLARQPLHRLKVLESKLCILLYQHV